MSSDITRFVGAKGDFKTYTFPDFYPMEFEYCNFITSYTLASVDPAYSNYNNTIGSMYDFTSVEPPVGMSLLDTTITTDYDRLPVTKRKISVDTDYERSYSYNIMIEMKLTKTTWADYLYSFSGTDHQISVVLGSPDPTATPKISAPTSGFPSDADGEPMFLTLTVGAGTDNIYEYVFDHFSCQNSDLNSQNSPIITCDLYNISSSNTRLVPIVDFNGYSIQPPT